MVELSSTRQSVRMSDKPGYLQALTEVLAIFAQLFAISCLIIQALQRVLAEKREHIDQSLVFFLL